MRQLYRPGEDVFNQGMDGNQDLDSYGRGVPDALSTVLTPIYHECFHNLILESR